MTVKRAYSTTELCELLKLTRKAVLDRARRESWTSRPRPGRGGGHEWLLDSMPEAARQAVATAIASRMAGADKASLPRIAPDLFTVNTVLDIPERKREKATVRALLVSLARNFHKASGSSRTTAYETFTHEYNRGVIDAPDWVRGLIPFVCRKSLVNWEDRLGRRGLRDLTDRYGEHRKGKGLIDSTPGMADVIVACLVKYYDEAAEEVLNALKVTHAGQPLPSLRGLQRWMKQYRAANPRTLLKIQNPDGYKSRHQAAFGSRSAGITRLNELWELDV